MTTILIVTGYELFPNAEEEGENLGIGRLVSERSGDEQCLNLAKEWFHRCVHSHGVTCAMGEEAELPKRLVYVPSDPNEHLQVRITKGQRGQYAALSYCWGQGTRFQTTVSTINERMAGFPSTALPLLLRDAVDITRRFGLQYIWIDALCIIQADEVDWSTESAKMASVYGNSAITICADLAGGTNTGIHQLRNPSTSHSFGFHGEYRLQVMSQPWAIMCYQPLYSRGWAFQERILARRVLHFLSDQIAWECNTALYREQFRGRQTDFTAHFCKKQVAAWYHQKHCPAPSPHPYGAMLDLDDRISRWNTVIQEIAVRQFTVDTDRLPAISGLAYAIKTPEMGEYMAGVWQGDPFKSMMWWVGNPGHQGKAEQRYTAPSWSWVWTKYQILWPYMAVKTDLPAAQIDKWVTWNEKFGPKVLEYHVKLKSSDIHGEVLRGTYLVMNGYCRDIYFAEHPGTTYDAMRSWGDEFPCLATSYIHLDRRSSGCAFASSFDQHALTDQHPEISKQSVRKCLCVQIARERRLDDHFSKVIALMLEPCDVDSMPGFQRIGIFLLNHDDATTASWEVKELRLF
jgi:hypothetical protein